MKNIFGSLCLIVLILLVSPGWLSAAMTSDNYQIWQDAISVGGGDDQSSGNYDLRDTLGEFAVGRSSSTNYGAKIGFREVSLFEGAEVLSLSLSAASLELGELKTTQAATGAVTLTVDTNSATGVSVTFSGATLTCSACTGTRTVSAIGATGAGSSVGTSQFGFNAIYNSGAAPRASSLSPYNTAGQYAFNSGDQIISSSGGINATTFDINFLANIKGNEKSGNYTATLTYTATANF